MVRKTFWITSRNGKDFLDFLDVNYVIVSKKYFIATYFSPTRIFFKLVDKHKINIINHNMYICYLQNDCKTYLQGLLSSNEIIARCSSVT